MFLKLIQFLSNEDNISHSLYTKDDCSRINSNGKIIDSDICSITDDGHGYVKGDVKGGDV